MDKTVEGILMDLIAIRSCKENFAGKEAIIDYVKSYFSPYKDVLQTEYNVDKSPAILLSVGQAKYFDIFYTSHLDVTDGSHDDFVPRSYGYKIYGKGAADAKGGAAMLIKMFENTLRTTYSKKIGLLLTTGQVREDNHPSIDLELMRSLSIEAKCAIETNNKSLEYNHIVNACKGVMLLKFTTKGKSAHGSRPWEGENAIINLMEDLQSIKDIFVDDGSGWNPTLNIGTITGGNAVNSIPDYAEALIDIRTTSDKPEEWILGQIHKHIKHATVEIVMHKPGFYTNEENVYIQTMKAVMEDAFHMKVPILKEEGSSNVVALAEKHIPVFLCKPLSYGNRYSNEEWVSIYSLNTYVELFDVFNKTVCATEELKINTNEQRSGRTFA